MKLELFILGITAFLIYNTLHDGIYIKNIFKYKKYYQIGFYCIAGFSLYLLLKRDPIRLKKMLLNSNDMIKYLPIDKNSMDMISPIIDFTNSNNSFMKNLNDELDEENPNITFVGNNNVGGNMNKPTKRSVSETKKKFVASSQDWKCGRCGDKLTHTFEVDHKISLQYGGSNDVSNLISLCCACHREKTALEKMNHEN